MNIRTATLTDSAAMLAIYAPNITDSTASFEYEVPSLDDFTGRIQSTLDAGFPWLVLEEDSQVTGYAYGNLFGQRKAYHWTASVTIYLSPTAQGRGQGSALYQALFDQLAQLGYRSIYAIVTGENQGSLAFHKKLGFAQVGVFPEIGFKHDKWLDVYYLCKFLTPQSVSQQFPRKFKP